MAPSWPWNSIFGLQTTLGWPWSGVLGTLMGRSWPWNGILEALVTKLTLEWRFRWPDGAKSALELRFCWPWNGVLGDPMASCGPWNGVWATRRRFDGPGTAFWIAQAVSATRTTPKHLAEILYRLAVRTISKHVWNTS